MCCSVLAPGFLYTMCSVNVFVIDYILQGALQAHNNSCCQFCECVWCMCMLWEVEHAVWYVPGVKFSKYSHSLKFHDIYGIIIIINYY